MESIVIATIKSWNIKNALEFQKKWQNKYDIHLITDKRDLSVEFLEKAKPIYVFFPHWSWIIPTEIYRRFECVVFHTADLPYGRGGSPLQNLIIRGIKWTKVSAIKVDGGLDTGPIYLKKDVFIGLGSAEEIFIEISKIIFEEIIPEILENRPKPVPQTGEILEFKRRKPEESNLAQFKTEDLLRIYDFIRMLDAEGYPKAFLRLGPFKIIFLEAHLKIDRICGRFEIIKEDVE